MKAQENQPDDASRPDPDSSGSPSGDAAAAEPELGGESELAQSERPTLQGSADASSFADSDYPLRRQDAPPDVPGYEIVGVLGRGSAGSVYRAVQLAVEREVALKVLHPELTGKPRVVRRLQREARTMARLAHPNIVAAYDMGVADDRWWVAMELIDGPSLLERLRSHGRLSERECLRLFVPIAEGLEYLWEHGVVHRDVKPANILLSTRQRGAGTGRAVLADLGLAFADDGAGLTRQGGGTLGTPHYMSPEQARDASDVDVRADIWGFGATLFHALCGRPPFEGSSMAEVLSAVLHGAVPDPRRVEPNVSAGMALVVRKCLVRDPERRYQTPRELLDDLERLRERRAPAVRRADLDPLDRRLRFAPPAWVLGPALGLAVGLGAWMATAQPWRPAAPSANASASVQPGSYAPLDALLERSAEAPRELGPALIELENLRGAVPDGAEWWVVHNELVRRARAAVSGVLGALEVDVSEALAGGDLRRAAELAGDQFDAQLAATLGASLSELPVQVQPLATGALAALRERVMDARKRTVLAHSKSLKRRFEQIELPQLDAMIDGRRFASALASLDREPRERLAAIDVPLARLPGDDVEAIGASLAGALAEQRDRIRNAWTDSFRELERWLAAETERRAASFSWRTPRDQAGAGLGQALTVHLEELNQAADELTAVGAALLDEELERMTTDLDRRWGEVVRAGALRAHALRRDLVVPELWSQRRFDAAHALLSEFDATLFEAGPVETGTVETGTVEAADDGSLTAMRAELSRSIDDTRRLQALESAAVAGVRRAVSEELVLELELIPSDAAQGRRGRGIRLDGTLSGGSDPLDSGFRFRVADGREYLLLMERLARADFEELALLGVEDAAVADAWIAIAVLRRVDGDRAGALAALQRAGASSESRVGDLRWELLRDVEPESAPSKRERARVLLEALGRPNGETALESDDPAAASAIASVLLELYGDVLEVSTRASELRLRAAAIAASQSQSDRETQLARQPR